MNSLCYSVCKCHVTLVSLGGELDSLMQSDNAVIRDIANGKEYNFTPITQMSKLQELCSNHYHPRVVANFSHLVK